MEVILFLQKKPVLFSMNLINLFILSRFTEQGLAQLAGAAEYIGFISADG